MLLIIRQQEAWLPTLCSGGTASWSPPLSTWTTNYDSYVQATGSLATYSLLLWDSLMVTPSEHMDDYLFYAKAVTKCLEFLVATAIVFGGTQ
jgi:TRC8 N-terminal domain